MVRVGAKTFTEQFILARLIERRLTRAGFQVELRESLGSTVAFDALTKDQLDVYVDYSGTLWANAMQRSEVLPGWRVQAELDGFLAARHGIHDVGPLGFENTYALAMRRDQAEALQIRSIEDLAKRAATLRLGSDYEFLQRPEWQRLKDTYGLSFQEMVSFDSTFMYGAVKDGRVDVITAFSTDGRIAAYDLVVLTDPRQAFPPYDAIVLVSGRAARDARVSRALAPLVGAIDAETMRSANLRVDRDEDKQTPAAAAEWLDEIVTRARAAEIAGASAPP